MLSKLLKGCICYAFNIKSFSKTFKKYLQKIKDFVGYNGPHMLYKTINKTVYKSVYPQNTYSSSVSYC